jgi:ABC-type glycerol-3-phosphate transport system permease component
MSAISFGRNDDPLRRLVVYFSNTLLISAGTVAVCLVMSVGGALVASRSSFRWSHGLRQISLWGYVIPPIVLIFPYGHLLSSVGLQGTRIGLLLAHIAFCMPLSLWLMTQYFDAIPLQWDRTAEADGLSCATTLKSVLLPRAVTGIAAVATFVAVLSWNDVILAYVLASERTKTLGIGIQEAFPNETLSSNSTAAAATLLASIPLVLGVLVTYAYVVRQMRREWGISS